jgi:hypothetical protein
LFARLFPNGVLVALTEQAFTCTKSNLDAITACRAYGGIYECVLGKFKPSI